VTKRTLQGKGASVTNGGMRGVAGGYRPAAEHVQRLPRCRIGLIRRGAPKTHTWKEGTILLPPLGFTDQGLDPKINIIIEGGGPERRFSKEPGKT